ncbi:MAG: helix-turn-helix domain-containing protein, partial [Planctomycetales bacterium]
RDLDVTRVLIEMCAHRGWRIPEDVAIIAGYNEGQLFERPEPSISSLEVPYEQLGFEAARLLDRLMDEKSRGKRRKKEDAGKTAPEIILLPPVEVVARRSTDFHAVDDPTVRRALRFLDANLHQPLSVDRIAEAAGVSRRTLENRFREKLGRTIAAEIQRLRIERTKRELAGTDRPIQQIARLVGFGSPRTLNDLFRKMVGCTPREYRRRILAK